MKSTVALMAGRAIGLMIVLGTILTARADDRRDDLALHLILQGRGDTDAAPHGSGNVYAPDVLVEDGLYRMWYGGQGRDGHDRIHYAESRDGRNWIPKGVVLEDRSANHVNDPSVVKVGHTYYLYYTRAGKDVVDEIALATSEDGIHWERQGVVLKPGEPDAWDGLLVGRPSVLHDGGTFRMWFDGRKDLPLGAPAENVPKSPHSRRSIGYATSKDGLHWTRHPHNPVFGHDAGGVDVERFGQHLVMVYESRDGTKAATSADGLSWHDRGLWLPRSGKPIDRFGHVTPCLLAASPDGPCLLYLGAASAATWDHNSIAQIPISSKRIAELFEEP